MILMYSRTLRLLIVAAGFLALASLPVCAESFDHEHGPWNLLVKNHVRWNYDQTASEVDYKEFKRRKDFLTRYLQMISSVSRSEFDSFTTDQQLAFLINTYNAYTIELILSDYPEVESIKDLGSFFSSPWKKKFFRLFGDRQHLDGIEHDLIRGSGRYNEPLIHFAVNCASVGCPALANEAYVAETLEEQLLESSRRFLGDRTRNRFDAETGTLEISSIFKWYAEDFTKGWRGYDSLQDFFRTHADWITDDSESEERLKKGSLKIEFLDYDWALNEYK